MVAAWANRPGLQRVELEGVAAVVRDVPQPRPSADSPTQTLGRTQLPLFTGRIRGAVQISLRTAGYDRLLSRLARVPIRLDPLHGTFLVGMFDFHRRQGVT
jgi:hypothetical protein